MKFLCRCDIKVHLSCACKAMWHGQEVVSFAGSGAELELLGERIWWKVSPVTLWKPHRRTRSHFSDNGSV